MLSACLVGTACADTEPDIYCGGRCLFVALRALEIPVESYDALEQALGSPHPAGYSMQDLASAAEHFGARTLGVQTTLANLQRRPGRFACITHVQDQHFVLFVNVEDETVSVLDGAELKELAAATCNAIWKGHALLISRSELVPEAELSDSWSMWLYALGALVLGTILATYGQRIWAN
jgi:ABC-type bacteriocin/lantibiotic exporter with double-glycine peptidase domain